MKADSLSPEDDALGPFLLDEEGLLQEEIRAYTPPAFEGYVPTAALRGEAVDHALRDEDTFGAFQQVMGMRGDLPELTDEELKGWARYEPEVMESPQWDLFLKAVVAEFFQEYAPHLIPSWCQELEPLDLPWEPLEPLTRGEGPFDALNIIISAEDYYHSL